MELAGLIIVSGCVLGILYEVDLVSVLGLCMRSSIGLLR